MKIQEINKRLSEKLNGDFIDSEYQIKNKLMKLKVGDLALKANRSVEPMVWIPFVVTEEDLKLIEKFPEDYLAI